MTPDPSVMRNYFAQWQRKSTNRWSRIHWFVDGAPACGLPDPADDEKAFRLPPEPIITCRKCQRLNEMAMAPNLRNPKSEPEPAP